MSKGRFQIDRSGLDDEDQEESVAGGELRRRLGPMATAIRETQEAASSNQGLAADADLAALELAVQMKKLREAQLDLRLIPLEEIDEHHLKRDRGEVEVEALGELKASIAEHGLSQPIRVDRLDNGLFGLNQGRRRLHAFRGLLAETGDARYARIPALVDTQGARVSAYRRMVDENLIRENVSYAEMAMLAIAYAEEAAITPEDAITQLYASSVKAKRYHISCFVQVLRAIGDRLRFASALSRNVGVELAGKLQNPAAVQALREALLERAPETAEEERRLLESVGKEGQRRGNAAPRKAPARFHVSVGADEKRRVDVSIADGRLVIAGFKAEEVDIDAVKAFVAQMGGRAGGKAR